MDDLKKESMKQQAKGTAQDVKGRIKEAAGDLTNRSDIEAEGQADQAEGAIRKEAGRAGERLSDAADSLKNDDDR